MLVSCLMPTRDRRHLLPLAIQCFLHQTHEERELVILDDGDQSIYDLIPRDPRIHLHSGSAVPQTVGTKRNQLLKLAHGPVCCHWDDDDWSANNRIEHQLATLLTSGKALAGFNSFYYWDTTTSRAHIWALNASYPVAPGSSQMYLRTWALQHPFRPINIPEDKYFEQEAFTNHQSVSEPGLAYLVARYHPANTWRRTIAERQYPQVPRTALPNQFFLDAGIS